MCMVCFRSYAKRSSTGRAKRFQLNNKLILRASSHGKLSVGRYIRHFRNVDFVKTLSDYVGAHKNTMKP